MQFSSTSHLGPPASAQFDLLRIDQNGEVVGFVWVRRVAAQPGELGRQKHLYVTGPSYDPDPVGLARSFHQVGEIPNYGPVTNKDEFVIAMQQIYPTGAQTWFGLSVTFDHWPWEGEPRQLDRGSVGIVPISGGPERGFVFTDYAVDVGGVTYDRVEFWGSHTAEVGPHLPNLLSLASTQTGTGQTLAEFQEFLVDWMDQREGPYRYEEIRLFVREGVTADP